MQTFCASTEYVGLRVSSRMVYLGRLALCTLAPALVLDVLGALLGNFGAGLVALRLYSKGEKARR